MENPALLPLAWQSLCLGELSVRLSGASDTYLLVSTGGGPRPLAEVEVAAVRALASGQMAKRVASDLALSPSTLSRLVKRTVEKLGFGSTTEMLGVLGAAVEPQLESALQPLTAAEREVLALIQAGLSNREIGERRGRSERTVANQVASILRKTGLEGRRALVARIKGARQLHWDLAALARLRGAGLGGHDTHP